MINSISFTGQQEVPKKSKAVRNGALIGAGVAAIAEMPSTVRLIKFANSSKIKESIKTGFKMGALHIKPEELDEIVEKSCATYIKNQSKLLKKRAIKGLILVTSIGAIIGAGIGAIVKACTSKKPESV